MGIKLRVAIMSLVFAVVFAMNHSYAQSTRDFPEVSAEIDAKNQISVYPNPTSDFIIVRLQNSDLTNAKVELYDILGNIHAVELEKIDDNSYKIVVKDFARGYYLVSVKDDSARFRSTLKFLKQ